MKITKSILLVLPAYVLLSACGSKPDPSSVARSAATPAAQSPSKVESTATADVNQGTTNVNIADLQAQQASLEAQKSSLLSQQKQLESQKAAFVQPADLQGAAFGDFMANAQALPAIDQAVLDEIIQAAMDMDIDALQAAVQDLIADLQDALADLQAQIDDLAAQIQAAQS